jgi:hypothetical protein
MKKITLTLFAVASAIGSAFSQANISIVTPTINNATQVRLPNGTTTYKSLKGVMLIKQSELTALTANQITSMGFILQDGTDPLNSVGNFSVYLQNTADVTNNKIALGYNAAITTMTMVYNNTWTVSNTAVQTTVNVSPFIAPASYTGGGLYVAYHWEETAPAVNTQTYPATWRANYIAGSGLCGTSNASTTAGAADALGATDFRPVVVFNALNTATNELEVVSVDNLGKIAKLAGTGQTITAVVRNNGTTPVSNFSVGLTISGANTVGPLIQTVAGPLAGGATATVTFNGVTSNNLGLNTINVGIVALPDQNPNNNVITTTQSITCSEIALHPSLVAGSYTQSAYGAGASASGIIYSFRYTAPANASATAVRLVIPGFANAQNLNKQIFPVILDNTGAIIGQGNPVTITTAMLDVFSTHNLTAPVQLTAGQDYNFGIAIPANAYFPIGNAGYSQLVNTPFSTIPTVGYYQTPITGGAYTPINYGNLSLEGVLMFSNTQITAAATKTAVCKASPQTLTLTATGADSYTWSPAGLGNSGTAVYTPTASGNVAQVSVIGGYTTASAAGCKSNNATLTFTLLACLGVNDNTGADAVKVFPNPTIAGKTVISNLSGVNSITVFNTLGQVVISTTTSNETETVDISSFPAGNYLVKITDSNNESRTIKLINQN